MLCVSIAWVLAQRPYPSSTALVIVGAMVKLVCTICGKKANSQKALVHHHTKEHNKNTYMYMFIRTCQAVFATLPFTPLTAASRG